MPSRRSSTLEKLDRWLRGRPRTIAAIVVSWIAVVAFAQDRLDSHLWLIVTYAVPVTLAGYGLGFGGGLVAALVTSTLLVVHAHSLGLTEPDAILVVVTRLTSSLAIAALSAIASGAARARDAFLEEQRATAQLRRDLVAAFAHDLRSPLAAIVGYTDMIRDETKEGAAATAPQILATLDRIDINARQMNELVGDMLATEQGASANAPDTTSFTAAALVEELRAELDVIASTRPGRLTWRIAPQTPPFATDRSKLVSIVRNLVGNALKYGGRCWIRVTVDFDAERERHCIEVADTGPGIAPEKLPFLFERFYRGTAPGDRGGFGLGLFIVRSLTQALGGEVSVESEVGRGTRFRVTIPRRPAAPADGEKTPAVGEGASPFGPTLPAAAIP